MAAAKFTSRRDVYRLISMLNSSLRYVIQRLEVLSSSKVLSPKYLKEMSELTKQVDAVIAERLRGKRVE
jgi:hypothetical protein